MPSLSAGFAPAPRSWKHSTARLLESEQRRSLAIAAGKMGSWDWDWINGDWMWDEGQFQIFGVDPASFTVTPANIQALFHPDDIDELRKAMAQFGKGERSYEAEFRISRPDGEMRWCVGTAAATIDKGGRVVRLSGVTVDITERKLAEQRQNLLAREVDHRAKNALALAQSIVRLTRGDSASGLHPGGGGPDQRTGAGAHHPVAVELAGCRNGSAWSSRNSRRIQTGGQIAFAGLEVQLQPATAQTLALALHELVTNSAKYGALSPVVGTPLHHMGDRRR